MIKKAKPIRTNKLKTAGSYYRIPRTALVLNFGGVTLGGYAHAGEGVNTFLLFILFVLLGWQVYGPPVHG